MRIPRLIWPLVLSSLAALCAPAGAVSPNADKERLVRLVMEEAEAMEPGYAKALVLIAGADGFHEIGHAWRAGVLLEQSLQIGRAVRPAEVEELLRLFGMDYEEGGGEDAREEATALLPYLVIYDAAVVSARRQHYRKALAISDEFTGEDRDEVLLEMARTCLADGQTGWAFRMAQACGEVPARIEALRDLAEVLGEEGKTAEAVRALAIARETAAKIEEVPEKDRELIAIAQACADLGVDDLAGEAVTMIAGPAQQIEAWAGAAASQFAGGRPDRAAASLDRAAELCPDHRQRESDPTLLLK